MLFTFRRDDEGRERIYVGDVHIADIKRYEDKTERCHYTGHVPGVDFEHITSAIERADAAGFWDSRGDAYYVTTQTWKTTWMHNEVTVDVPVPETTTTLILVSKGDDES